MMAWVGGWLDEWMDGTMTGWEEERVLSDLAVNKTWTDGKAGG